MDKNEFDRDFDYEKESDFDPKAFLGTEEYDDDIDLSEFSDEELGLVYPADADEDEDVKEYIPASQDDASDEDCGNYLDLNLTMANYWAARYAALLENIDGSRLVYPE